MCGRYAIYLPADFIAGLFRDRESVAESPADLECGAGRRCAGRAACCEQRAPRGHDEMGLVPYFTKDLKKARKPINAKSETVANPLRMPGYHLRTTIPFPMAG
jgi:hypothetical protein